MNQYKSRIFTITGPSGSGKSTIANGNFTPEQTLVSFTTRDPRPGEVDGIDYYFVDESDVNDMLEKDLLLEHVVYNGHHYGYTKDEFSEKLKNGDVVAVVNIDGYKGFKDLYFIKTDSGELYSDIVHPVFIDIDKENVIKHFESRVDSKDNIKNRISLFEEEIKNKEYFESEGAYILNINGLDSESGIKKFANYIKSFK